MAVCECFTNPYRPWGTAKWRDEVRRRYFSAPVALPRGLQSYGLLTIHIMTPRATGSDLRLRLWEWIEPYDHEALAENWRKIDQHDMQPGRGINVPKLSDGTWIV